MNEGRSISTEGRSSPDLGCRDLGTMKHCGTRGLTEKMVTHRGKGSISGKVLALGSPLYLYTWPAGMALRTVLLEK